MSDKARVLLERLYREMFDDLVRLANTRLRDIQCSKDMVQDTFVAAQENIDKLMGSPNPEGWITETLKNKIKHEQRARARFKILLENMDTQTRGTKPSGGEIWQWLAEILDADELALLKLIYKEGYNYLEAAEKLNISYVACRKRAQRAKDKIRQNPPK